MWGVLWLSACALPAPKLNTSTLSKTLDAHGYPVVAALESAQYIDLNSDDRLDAVILLEHRDYCGSGGCTALLLENTATGFRLVNDIATSDYVSVQDCPGDGWCPLWIGTSGGGLPPAIEKYVYAGGRYRRHQLRYVKDIAYDYARATEIYTQDGHNLTLLSSSQIRGCTSCYRYVFSFDHYGDPAFDYTLTVEVRRGHPGIAED